jgi:transcriptional regulator GlxA family with amidase domain
MQRVGVIVMPGFHIMTLAALSVYEFANRHAGEKLYDIAIVSEHGGPVADSLGTSIGTAPWDPAGYDTLIIGSTIDVSMASPALLDYLRGAAQASRRIASICQGALILAEAGLLDGRRATTHWVAARDLQARYPAVKVEDDRIFIIDGPIWTSAGMTAGIDLALAMVEKDFGAELARRIARSLVVYHRRSGGQSQHSALLDIAPKSDRIQSALTYAKANLKTALSVEQLADAAHLSPRQFSRAFRAETGQSPAKAVENLRVEAARLMMEDGRHPIDTVARETGFADRERMRRAFLRAFGQPPQTIRRNARAAQAA